MRGERRTFSREVDLKVTQEKFMIFVSQRNQLHREVEEITYSFVLKPHDVNDIVITAVLNDYVFILDFHSV